MKREWRPSNGLPMPFTGKRGPFSRTEWDEYRRRQKLHHERHPDYANGWQRPSKAIAEVVWDLLALRFGIKLDPLLPTIKLKLDELPTVALTIKQAFAVAVDAAVTAGERGQMLTTNRVFDAVARRWSDHYRKAIETTPARLSYEMKPETVTAAWRDLLRAGIRFETAQSRGLWAIVRDGCPGLYQTKRVQGDRHALGYAVKLEDSSLYRSFREKMPARPKRSRLVLAGQLLPPRPDVKRVAGEKSYLIVRPGERSRNIIRRLEAANFYLDVNAFRKTAHDLDDRASETDAQIWDTWRANVKASRARHGDRRSAYQWTLRRVPHKDVALVQKLDREYLKHAGQLAEIKKIGDEIDRLERAGKVKDGLLKIRAGYVKSVNRRYHAFTFSPLEVTGSDEQEEVIDQFGHEEMDFETIETTSRRGRWFFADALTSREARLRQYERSDGHNFLPDIQPLIERDVSSSQFQVLAAFIGLRDFERKISTHSFKDMNIEKAWALARARRSGFREFKRTPEGEQHIAATVKEAALTGMYFSTPHEIAYKLHQKPQDFGPGLNEKAVKVLLDETGVSKLIRVFKPVVQAAVSGAGPKGVTLVDPFDKTRFTWDYLDTKKVPVKRGATAVWVNTPTAGLNTKKLLQAVGPCLIHTLDSAFSGFVIEELAKRGVHDVSAIHDAWLVPLEAEAALDEAITAAGQPWLRSLGPLYRAILTRVKGTTQHQVVKIWYDTWKRRVARKDWPLFLTKEGKLRAEDVRESATTTDA